MDDLNGVPAVLSADPTAKLPAKYEAARAALAVCDRIDECKTWADKAAALAAYARQAKDDSLAVYARRIQARAMRRAGELLKNVPRGDTATRFGQDRNDPPITRTQAADDAGLSERQRKTALRVAAVPAEDFDYAVESQDPPTVTQLASAGTQSRPAAAPDLTRPVQPAERAEMLEAVKAVFDFWGFCERVDPVRVAIALKPNLAVDTRAEVVTILRWLERFAASLPK